jgi:hypothetical protein
MSDFFVEPAGVEPASKQVTKVLSTCLSFYWFSTYTREKAPKTYAYLFYLILASKPCKNGPDFVGASNHKGIRQSLM